MGAPLVGSEVQLAALCGGGLYVRDLGLRRRCPRLLMAFSLTGPQRQGLVTLDVKKRKLGGGIGGGGGAPGHDLQPEGGYPLPFPPPPLPLLSAGAL